MSDSDSVSALSFVASALPSGSRCSAEARTRCQSHLQACVTAPNYSGERAVSQSSLTIDSPIELNASILVKFETDVGRRRKPLISGSSGSEAVRVGEGVRE